MRPARHFQRRIRLRPSRPPQVVRKRSLPARPLPDGRDLHIVKDLSELDSDGAITALEESLTRENRVTVVCANEGRLRAVLGATPSPELRPVRQALDGVLLEGRTSETGSIHVIDMNHQSVAAPGGRSLVRQALKAWASDRRKWTSCDQCDAKSECPYSRTTDSSVPTTNKVRAVGRALMYSFVPPNRQVTW